MRSENVRETWFT